MSALYETKTERYYDLILLAHCDKDVQKKRVLTRDKISSLLYEKILASQLNFKDKIKFHPQIINTNRTKLFIFIKILLLLIRILIKLKLQYGKKKVNT